LVTLLLITAAFVIGGYLVAFVVWYLGSRKEPEAGRVRGRYAGERGARAEAATGRRSGSLIHGSGHA